MANPSSKNTDIALFVCDDPYVKTIISDFYRAISSHYRLNSNSRLRFSLNVIRPLNVSRFQSYNSKDLCVVQLFVKEKSR